MPWIFPRNSYGLGGRVDLSNFCVPEINTELTVIFPYHDIYSGFYVGYWQNTPTTHQTLFDEDYPECYGWIDSVIQWFKINKKKPYLEFFRQTLQDMIRLDENGNLWINVPKSLIINVGETYHLNVKDNKNEKIGSVKNVKTGSDLNYTVGGNYAENVSGEHGLKTGSTHGVESGGDISHQATNIWHNSGIIYGTAASGASELSSDISVLISKIAELQTKIDELKAQADALETSRDSIKNSLQAEAKGLIGT